MTKIRFVEHDGTEHTVEAKDGESLMRAAIDNGVPGIQAECGGNLSCSTCHGYVEQAFFDMLPPPGDDEIILLEGTLDPQPTSRLTCQVIVKPELDGMVVRWPESQY